MKTIGAFITLFFLYGFFWYRPLQYPKQVKENNFTDIVAANPGGDNEHE